jgi:hypothetical protein
LVGETENFEAVGGGGGGRGRDRGAMSGSVVCIVRLELLGYMWLEFVACFCIYVFRRVPKIFEV